MSAPSADSSARRMLLVHAHPDDETINTGALMAKYAAAGVAITLVTCTLGEEGEILLPEMAHLAADRDGGLGAYRLGELHRAMRELGVEDVRILGGAGRHRDSGMAGSDANSHADAFAAASMAAVVADLANLIVEVRPHVVITYDADGGYGHPDHIRAHDATHAAVRRADELGWSVQKVYACARRKALEVADREHLRAMGAVAPFAAGDDDLSWAVDDAAVTTAIDAEDFAEQKRLAMLAHATQIAVSADGRWYALSDGVGNRLRSVEYLTCVRGRLGSMRDPDGFEVDVFDGVAT